MNRVVCPVCSNEIKPVAFGDGLVWVCCGKVAHSVSRVEESKRKQADAGAGREGAKE